MQGEDVPISEWQRAELERRRQEYRQNPGAVVPWSEVKRSILESARMGRIEPKETKEDAE